MKKTGFNGYVYDFSVDYDATDINDIKDIHKYLMKKNNVVQYVRTFLKDTTCKAKYKMFGFIKKVFFIGLTVLSGFTSVNSLNCISISM